MQERHTLRMLDGVRKIESERSVYKVLNLFNCVNDNWHMNHAFGCSMSLGIRSTQPTFRVHACTRRVVIMHTMQNNYRKRESSCMPFAFSRLITAPGPGATRNTIGSMIFGYFFGRFSKIGRYISSRRCWNVVV